MGCQTSGCPGEHELATISHTVLYWERSIVLHNVPAGISEVCRLSGMDSSFNVSFSYAGGQAPCCCQTAQPHATVNTSSFQEEQPFRDDGQSDMA
jgi:hypothetical protein